MEIVTGIPAPTQEPDIVRETLLELAAVIRTIFGAPAVQAPVQPAPVRDVAPVAVAAPSAPAPAAPLVVPDLPHPLAVPDLPGAPTMAAAPAAIAVPQIPVPDLAPAPHDDPAERHSMALLQEIAFLDD